MFDSLYPDCKIYNFKKLTEEEKKEVLGMLRAISVLDGEIYDLDYQYDECNFPKGAVDMFKEHSKNTLENAQSAILACVNSTIAEFIDERGDFSEIPEANDFLYGFAEEYPYFAKEVFPDDEDIAAVADPIIRAQEDKQKQELCEWLDEQFRKVREARK